MKSNTDTPSGSGDSQALRRGASPRLSLPFLCLAAGTLMMGPCDLGAQSLADLAKQTKKAAQSQPAKRTFTNDDLNNLPAENVDLGPGSGPRAEVVVTSPVTARSGPPLVPETTSLGQDEGYWRSRTEQFVATKADAQTRADEIQSELNQLYPLMWAADDPGRRTDLQNQIDAKEKSLAQARQALTKATEDLDNLSDEARKAGALPGWVRHD